jgi:hypothetical protein
MHTKNERKKRGTPTHGLLALLLAWLACPILPIFFQDGSWNQPPNDGKGPLLGGPYFEAFSFFNLQCSLGPPESAARACCRGVHPGRLPRPWSAICSTVAARRRWRSRDGHAVAVRVSHCRAEGVV